MKKLLFALLVCLVALCLCSCSIIVDRLLGSKPIDKPQESYIEIGEYYFESVPLDKGSQAFGIVGDVVDAVKDMLPQGVKDTVKDMIYGKESDPVESPYHLYDDDFSEFYFYSNGELNKYYVEAPNEGSRTSNACGDSLTWEINGSTLFIRGEGIMWDFGSWNSPWREYAEEITHIVIEDGVTSIGWNAFEYMTALTSTDIADSVEYIGHAAFWQCKNLSYISLPENLIGFSNQVFDGCESLTRIELPANLKYIDTIGASIAYIDVDEDNPYYKSIDGVLFDKKGTFLLEYPAGMARESYKVPDSTLYIAEGAISNSFLRHIEFPDSIKQISLSNAKVTYIDVPDGVIALDITRCENISYIDVPDSVRALDVYECDALTYINIPGGIKDKKAYDKEVAAIINDETYSYYTPYYYVAEYKSELMYGVKELRIGGCDKLTSIDIPVSVTYLDMSGDYYYDKYRLQLKTISIPNSLGYLSMYDFDDYYNLTDIYFGGTEEEWEMIVGEDYRDYLFSDVTVHFED